MPRSRLLTFLRSALAGGAATVVDVAVLSVLVSVLGVAPRVANVPSLVAGAAVSFVGNRHFAFRAGAGSLSRQAVLFVGVEIVTFVLNAVLFDLALRVLPATALAAAAARLAVGHVVFLLWSYPSWRHVFRVRAAEQAV